MDSFRKWTRPRFIPTLNLSHQAHVQSAQANHEWMRADLCPGLGGHSRQLFMIGCAPQTLHNWVAQVERDSSKRSGPTSDERERIKALERENRELRQANEILRKASAYFAQAELDRPLKR